MSSLHEHRRIDGETLPRATHFLFLSSSLILRSARHISMLQTRAHTHTHTVGNTHINACLESLDTEALCRRALSLSPSFSLSHQTQFLLSDISSRHGKVVFIIDKVFYSILFIFNSPECTTPN